MVNGEVLGRYGTYLNADKPADSSGNPLFTTGANFNFGYTKISGTYPGTSPGTRAVAAGETLQSIAKSIYGDSSLWYLVADANGLSSDRDLRVGQTLTLPNRVSGANNSSSFKPYNPGDVVGNTTPNLPSPPSGGGGGGCGVLGTIIMVVVAAVVTYFSAGALGGSAWAWAAGGAIGSVASQAVGIAIGAQEDFNWGAVAMAAISSGIGAGVSEAAQGTALGAQNAAGAAARAAIGNAMTQGVAVATGLQDRFSWTSVAASAVGAGVGAALDDSIMGTKIEGPTVPGQTLGRTGGLVGEMGGGSGAQLFGASLKGFAAGVSTAVARGGRVAVTQIATDAFGNALGESWGEGLARSAAEDRLAQLQAQASMGDDALKTARSLVQGKLDELRNTDDYLKLPVALRGREEVVDKVVGMGKDLSRLREGTGDGVEGGDFKQIKQNFDQDFKEIKAMAANEGMSQHQTNLLLNSYVLSRYEALDRANPNMMWPKLGIFAANTVRIGLVEGYTYADGMETAAVVTGAMPAPRAKVLSLALREAAGATRDMLQQTLNAQLEVLKDVGSLVLMHQTYGAKAMSVARFDGMTPAARSSFTLQSKAESFLSTDRAQFYERQTQAAIEMGRHEQGMLQKILWDQPAMAGYAKLNALALNLTGGKFALTKPDIYIGVNPSKNDGEYIPAPKGSWDLSNLEHRINIARNGFEVLNTMRQSQEWAPRVQQYQRDLGHSNGVVNLKQQPWWRTN